ncbi:alpha-hydroxy-acid oxidizing protein [Rhizobium laguerreae]|uniref:Alpha-hydroxy-acid oxidizing protein n=1 Tax=Rhizobium laguerreae TaxID=1076926 RepID=A0AB35FEL5_9HYPH|nr:alpha-hydroxy acid oxidase [Rhizobium laguerreae]MBY3064682.1 alpha-hydroxy-acid oxidizing protein [Rhizobium laguerreae]
MPLTTKRNTASGIDGETKVTAARTQRGSARLKRILALDDFEREARRYIPHPIFSYVNSGSHAMTTVRENRSAFDDFRLVPRVLVGVARRSQKVTLFGETYDSPFGVAPMGMESLVSYRGDLEIAAACQDANIPFIQSGASLIPLEDVRAACQTSWFQAYIPTDRQDLLGLLARVAAAGFKTLVVTVDMTAGALSEVAARAGFNAPFKPNLYAFWSGAMRPAWTVGNFLRTLVQHGMPHFENLDGGRGSAIVSRTGIRNTNRVTQNWETIRDIRSLWQGNLVIKGILHPGDVIRARENGADGVIISSHGGRQIDGVIPPIHALPACVSAAGDMPVMIDSGIRRGTDLIKCLALGARFCFVGRPFNFSTVLGGRVGVEHAIGLLRSEFSRDTGNMGLNSVDEISRDCLVQRSAAWVPA